MAQRPTRDLITIDGGKLTLNLHSGQTQTWDSQRRFVFMIAGTQGGKTAYGPWWLYREIYGGWGQKGLGGGDYLAVTSSYDLFKLKMLPALQEAFVHKLGLGRWWAGDRLIELRPSTDVPFQATRADGSMWGRIILRSAQAGGGLESATAKAAWLDEVGQDEFTLEAWEAVLRRLSLAQGRVLGTTTLYNLGWLKAQVYEPWRDGDPDFDVIQFASVINPAFPQAEFDRAERTLPSWRFSLFYLGEYAKPAGLIYGDFTDQMLVDPFGIPAHWERVVGVDFGGANTATLYLAQDPGSRLWYAYRELLEGGLSTNEHAQKAKTALDDAEDWAAIGGAPSETQERMDWKAGGLEVQEPPVSGVEPGISRVTGLIKGDEFRVFRNLQGLRDELGSYRRKLDDAGEPTEVIVNKRSFHRLDALRYAACYIKGVKFAPPGVVRYA